jgi:CrcB protein
LTQYLLVASGGALGSLARFLIGKKVSEKYKGGFPAGTFLINITGAVLLGAVSSAGLGPSGYSLFGDGFLGAFTTFSTFMYESFNLFQDNEKLNAAVYIAGSLVLGTVGFVTGAEIAGMIKMM